MWLLALAIALLVLSSPFTAYYTACLEVRRSERPPAFWMYGSFIIAASVFPFLAGIAMLFMAAGWRWGLAGLGMYWLLVVAVLIPLARRVRGGKLP